MEEKKTLKSASPRMKKAVKWVWVAFGVVVVLVVIASIADGGNGTKNTADNKEAAKTSQMAAPTTTLGKLQQASKEALGDQDGITVKYDKKAKSAELVHYESSFINTNDTIGEAYRDFVQWGNKIKNMPGVQQIDVATKTDFTDSYGKTDKENACEIIMSTKDFKKYNWDNLNGQPIHNQLNQSGYLIIHPAIRKQVNLNDIKLLY